MTPFISIVPELQGIITVIFLMSFFVVAGHVIAALWINHCNRLPFICELIIVFLCFQSCASIIKGEEHYGGFPWIVKTIGGIPWIMLALFGLIILVVNTILLYDQSRWKLSNITLHSIKQAVDRLPVGICYYDRHGLLLLKNHIMEELAFDLMGERLLNGKALQEMIEAGELPEGYSREVIQDNLALLLPDGKVFACYFSKENDEINASHSILITDITEEYKTTKCLQSQKLELEKANQRLIEYNKEITRIISQKEILAAKIKIHDELGITLLESKHYLLKGGSEDKKKEIIQAYRSNISCLLQENEGTTEDEYNQLIQAAMQLNVGLHIDGELPLGESQKHITATALHEFITNTIRHGKTDLVFVNSEETKSDYIVKMYNNGKLPEERISEQGGLKSLRELVEGIGGKMFIEAKEKFLLTLVLPKEEPNGEI